LKTLDADMVLKCNEFVRNPLDYSKYTKATKQVKDEFQLQRLIDSFNDGSLTLADYMYAVAAHLPVIEYIPEWLAVMNQDDEDGDLNVAINDLSLNNEIFNSDETNQVINQMNEEERVCQQRELDINEAVRLELTLFEKD
jgi:hypothetical protein